MENGKLKIINTLFKGKTGDCKSYTYNTINQQMIIQCKWRKKALSIRKVQLLYFNGEKTNFKAKILVSHSKIHEFSEEKLLNFSNVTYDVIISHFCHIRISGEKDILQKFLFFFPKTHLIRSYKKK